MKPGLVFIAEEVDPLGPGLIWTGRWAAHWESEGGETRRQGPRGVSAQEAIAWGRENADVVQIRPGDSAVFYSAGVQQPYLDEDCPRWPPGQEIPRRRWT